MTPLQLVLYAVAFGLFVAAAVVRNTTRPTLGWAGAAAATAAYAFAPLAT